MNEYDSAHQPPERLGLKVLRSDKLALQRLAAMQGETLSVVVRRILREELKRVGLLDTPSHTPDTGSQ